MGMGPGPIPDIAVYRFAKQDHLSRLETHILLYVIRALDNHLLSEQAERMKKQSN